MPPEYITDCTKEQEATKDPLGRPGRLKAWGGALVGLLENEEGRLFPGGWDFSRERITRNEFRATLAAMRSCGSALELRASLDRQTGELGPNRIHAGNYCHSPATCPICAGRAQDMRMKRFSGPIMEAAGKFRHAYLVTMTLPPSNTWAEGLQAVREASMAFRKMGQRRKGRASGKSGGEWGKVEGAIAKVELKRGIGSGLPHVHLHALAFTDSPFDYRIYHARPGKDSSKWPIKKPLEVWDQDAQKVRLVACSKLSEEWYRATGGMALSCDVKPLGLRKVDRRAGRTLVEAIAAQAIEVLKYATKFDSKPKADAVGIFAEDFAAIRSCTYGRRLFSTYGCFRGIPGDDFTDEENGESCAYSAAYWDGGEKRYTVLPKDGPIFQNEKNKERLKVLNGYLGRARRRRSAVMRARDRVLRGRALRVPCVTVEGGKEKVIMLDPPQYLKADKNNFELWEKWADDLRDASRAGYVALRETLRMQAEDPKAWELFLQKCEYQEEMKKPLWERGEKYWVFVVNQFREVLDPDFRASPS